MLAEISCNNSGNWSLLTTRFVKIEKKLQPFLCQGVIDRYRDLVCNKGQESLLFRRIRVVEMAGKCETSQSPMGGAQR